MNTNIDERNITELYLYQSDYYFIKGFACAKNFSNTLKALPLAEKMHSGQYRQGKTIVNDKEVDLPYICHCLKVCSTLMLLNPQLKEKELDYLYASALLHDVIEDGDMPKGGIEMVRDYGISEEVYKIVKLLSKRSGATQEELAEYFNSIKVNKLALLVKLADRSHNVEDLYNKRVEKLHKYVKETRDFIYPLAEYGRQTYPELSDGITLLKSKIISLTECTETITKLYEEKLLEKDAEIARLLEELNKK